MAKSVEVGQVLAGKYRVERVLGRGGMGIVVAARHLELGEPVAIKYLLRESLESEQRVARFLREGRAAARIRSEHVARVHDVGRLDDGTPYLVMEFLDGKDLADTIRDDGPMATEQAAEVLLQSCEAIASAHALGIVHRDIKPSNLFLARRQDGSLTVKVIDFGISKLATYGGGEDGDSGDGVLTKSTTLVGSPHYMAPEQMETPKEVDRRADIWSLGGTLHTMLTGELPFVGRTLLEVCKSMLEGVTPLRQLQPNAPAELEQLIACCLTKDRDQRYADVGELAEAIAPWAPPHLRPYAERIRRLLDAPTPRASGPESSIVVSTGSDDSATAATAVQSSVPTPGDALPFSRPTADTGGEPRASESQDFTAGPALTDAQPPMKRSHTLWVAGLAAGVAGAVAALWILTRQPATAELPAPAASAAPAHTTAPAEAATATKTAADTGSTASAATTSAATTSSATSRPETPTTTATPGTPAATPTSKPTTPPATQPTTDIWADPQ